MFDDDDYYAPHYLEQMILRMQEAKAHFVKLFGFFLYYETNGTFAYWDMTKTAQTQPDVDSTPLPRENALGFGFSYVFKKKFGKTSNSPSGSPACPNN
jgi:hypothetical protein